jgi:hypothetical protein
VKNQLKIGEKIYKFKKDALYYYKNILNSYKFGQLLNDDDYNDLIDLLNYNDSIVNKELIDNEFIQDYYCERIITDKPKSITDNIINEIIKDDREENFEIVDIKIVKVQFSTKCFEIIYNDLSSQCFSYIMMINRPKYNPDKLFNTACRNAIQNHINAIKKKYFKDYSINGFVKCQETNQMSKWEDLAVDHRQPNTFSVIVDRFKEVNKIDVANVEYSSDNNNGLVFENEKLIEEFRNYHKEKANLRIVRKECNSKRAAMARLKRSSKDLIIPI